QKSFAVMGSVEAALKLVPNLAVETVDTSCCGMAGAFGYAADTLDVSLKMGELSLFPAVRKAAPDTIVVADGTSCRHQIKDGTGREALHVARVLAMSVARGIPSGGQNRVPKRDGRQRATSAEFASVSARSVVCGPGHSSWRSSSRLRRPSAPMTRFRCTTAKSPKRGYGPLSIISTMPSRAGRSPSFRAASFPTTRL